MQCSSSPRTHPARSNATSRSRCPSRRSRRDRTRLKQLGAHGEMQGFVRQGADQDGRAQYGFPGPPEW